MCARLAESATPAHDLQKVYEKQCFIQCVPGRLNQLPQHTILGKRSKNMGSLNVCWGGCISHPSTQPSENG